MYRETRGFKNIKKRNHILGKITFSWSGTLDSLNISLLLKLVKRIKTVNSNDRNLLEQKINQSM